MKMGTKLFDYYCLVKLSLIHIFDHGCGVRSYLYGLQELSVTRGQTVERGQAVGVLGEELTMDFKLGSKSVNPWPLFQTSGCLLYTSRFPHHRPGPQHVRRGPGDGRHPQCRRTQHPAR